MGGSPALASGHDLRIGKTVVAAAQRHHRRAEFDGTLCRGQRHFQFAHALAIDLRVGQRLAVVVEFLLQRFDLFPGLRRLLL